MYIFKVDAILLVNKKTGLWQLEITVFFSFEKKYVSRLDNTFRHLRHIFNLQTGQK
jgi:hypothetical protein